MPPANKIRDIIPAGTRTYRRSSATSPKHVKSTYATVTGPTCADTKRDHWIGTVKCLALSDLNPQLFQLRIAHRYGIRVRAFTSLNKIGHVRAEHCPGPKGHPKSNYSSAHAGRDVKILPTQDLRPGLYSAAPPGLESSKKVSPSPHNIDREWYSSPGVQLCPLHRFT
jgi:hypothetical protein